jgi:hypothetical protein
VKESFLFFPFQVSAVLGCLCTLAAEDFYAKCQNVILIRHLSRPFFFFLFLYNEKTMQFLFSTLQMVYFGVYLIAEGI